MRPAVNEPICWLPALRHCGGVYFFYFKLCISLVQHTLALHVSKRPAALLSSRIDRYRRIQPAFSERLEERLGQSPLVPRKLVPAVDDFEQAYLASVLNESAVVGDGGSRGIWDAVQRIHASGAAVSTVLVARTNRLRTVLHSSSGSSNRRPDGPESSL